MMCVPPFAWLSVNFPRQHLSITADCECSKQQRAMRYETRKRRILARERFVAFVTGLLPLGGILLEMNDIENIFIQILFAVFNLSFFQECCFFWQKHFPSNDKYLYTSTLLKDICHLKIYQEHKYLNQIVQSVRILMDYFQWIIPL